MLGPVSARLNLFRASDCLDNGDHHSLHSSGIVITHYALQVVITDGSGSNRRLAMTRRQRGKPVYYVLFLLVLSMGLSLAPWSASSVAGQTPTPTTSPQTPPTVQQPTLPPLPPGARLGPTRQAQFTRTTSTLSIGGQEIPLPSGVTGRIAVAPGGGEIEMVQLPPDHPGLAAFDARIQEVKRAVEEQTRQRLPQSTPIPQRRGAVDPGTYLQTTAVEVVEDCNTPLAQYPTLASDEALSLLSLRSSGSSVDSVSAQEFPLQAAWTYTRPPLGTPGCGWGAQAYLDYVVYPGIHYLVFYFLDSDGYYYPYRTPLQDCTPPPGFDRCRNVVVFNAPRDPNIDVRAVGVYTYSPAYVIEGWCV